LSNPGYVCRSKWDAFSSACYWSSNECNATCSGVISFADGAAAPRSKTLTPSVRAFRRVTY
jgi:hypothetical protein